MAGKRTGERLLMSFFLIVNTRTAGFNSFDLSLLSAPSVILCVFLMFVGASPGSTGGGIKTTTFYLILVTAVATIKGEKSISIEKRSISNELIFKAFAVFTFAVSFNIIAIFLLSITESGIAVERLVFEQFSAFGTVGLSMGLTPSLSAAGKIIVLSSMFVGRVGLLTLALALSNKVISTSYKYPSEHIMVA
jgi:Trk-type K+ transport system membrane component